MEQKTLRLYILKNVLYTLLVLLCYVAQETPRLLTVAGVRPVVVIGAVVAIAMVEGEFAGGLFGLLAGLLCDTAAFHFFGVASIFFLVLGTAAGLLIIYLVQSNLRSAFLITGSFALAYLFASHYFIYGIWGYEGAARLLLIQTLPSVLYTALWGTLLFALVRHLAGRFDPDRG